MLAPCCVGQRVLPTFLRVLSPTTQQEGGSAAPASHGSNPTNYLQ